jgi:putative acetyltransferase
MAHHPGMETIETIRQAARQLVRELNLLDTKHCIEGFSISECHLITELEGSGEATAKEMGERLLLEKSTMSRLCNRLLERGYLEAARDPSDRRRKLLCLSRKGLEGAARIHRYARDQVGSAMSFIAEDDLSELMEGLSRYSKALRYARLSKEFTMRLVREEDNAAVAGIIRQVMTEYGAVGAGYSIHDAEVDDMFGAYPSDTSAFYIIEKQGKILGCGGVGPLSYGDPGTCELRKMYFLSELRGTGMGTRLLGQCLESARQLGYRHCYLETLESMTQARHLYHKHGFEPLDTPLGNTGHSSCNMWMAKDLVRNTDEL